MSALPKATISEKEYFELERKAEFKSDNPKGEIFAMAGATKEHDKIVASIIAAIGQYLKAKTAFTIQVIKECITQPIDYTPIPTLRLFAVKRNTLMTNSILF